MACVYFTGRPFSPLAFLFTLVFWLCLGFYTFSWSGHLLVGDYSAMMDFVPLADFVRLYSPWYFGLHTMLGLKNLFLAWTSTLRRLFCPADIFRVALLVLRGGACKTLYCDLAVLVFIEGVSPVLCFMNRLL